MHHTKLVARPVPHPGPPAHRSELASLVQGLQLAHGLPDLHWGGPAEAYGLELDGIVVRIEPGLPASPGTSVRCRIGHPTDLAQGRAVTDASDRAPACDWTEGEICCAALSGLAVGFAGVVAWLTYEAFTSPHATTYENALIGLSAALAFVCCCLLCGCGEHP